MNTYEEETMKRFIVLITIALPCLMPATAMADKFNSNFTLTLVNSSDDVSFDIASDLSGAETPNVLSELMWNDMTTWSLEGDVNIGLGKSFKIGLSGGVGAIVDGVASDRDFLGDNRTEVFSHAVATVDGKHRIYGDVNIGWQFGNSFEVPVFKVGKSGKSVALASTIAVTPRIGYSYSRQEIEFKDGVQLIPDLGPFEGLNSAYTPEWQGIYASLDGSFRVLGPVYLLVSAKYWPDAKFRADGEWNLRADLEHPVSFRHSADGSGYSFEAGLEWQFDTLKSIGITYGELQLETDYGYAEVYSIEYGDLYTRLNEATWESKGWFLQFRWRFGA
jgi:hypothetical protein